jgi:hypothetical protein
MLQQPLKSRVLALLIHLPPCLTAKEGFKKIEVRIHVLILGNYRYGIDLDTSLGLYIKDEYQEEMNCCNTEYEQNHKIIRIVWTIINESIPCIFSLMYYKPLPSCRDHSLWKRDSECEINSQYFSFVLKLSPCFV